jgi:hypothetical protein
VKKAGRPRKRRVCNSARDKKEKQRCSNCYEFGHYRNNCPNQPYERHGKAQRIRDQDVEEVETSLDEMSDFDIQSQAKEQTDSASDSDLAPSTTNSDLSHSSYTSNATSSSNRSTSHAPSQEQQALVDYRARQ